MSRLERIERDIERAQKKAREWQAKAKELDGQLTEAENIEIVAAVRALKMTRAEIRAFVNTGKLPAALADEAAIPAARFEKKKAEPVKAEAIKSNAVAGGKPDTATPAAASSITNNKDSEGKTNEA
jgi:hypothetical protein